LRAIANPADERLLIEAAQQDPSRFAELYETHFERVYAYIAHRVRSRDTVEELTAEVFHRALANLRRFEWRGVPFAAWLLRIAANVIADRWHHDGDGRGVSADELELPAVEYEIERRAMLFKLVDTLPTDQRLVIVRRFVEDKSVREIARELGRSEGAVKQLQFRALETLRARVRSTHV
jgi:RNA polymerase sigma-70 factor (ECF subfamily)